MDQRERINDLQEALLGALDGRQSGIWTALPGVITAYDAAKGTVTVQPAVQAQVRSQDGTLSWATLPPLVHVPVLFPQGGSFVITFPIAVGDECLVIFSSRCIDGWWQLGGTQPQVELRMHDLSDGFAIVGPRSQPRKLSSVSTDRVQVRTVDGSAYIEMTAGGVVNILASTVNITGDLVVNGTVVATGEGTFNGNHTVSAHKHGGVTTGTGQTGTPTG